MKLRCLKLCFRILLLLPFLSLQAEVLRIGHFPNITHAQALVGHNQSRGGKGWFEERLGDGAKIEWHVFNAGPSLMEGILTGVIDLAYVGPNPAINAHLRTKGKEIRVISGACSGGSALVVNSRSGISSTADFRYKRLASPQLANTQDVAARSYFRSLGWKVTLTGGDLYIVPTANPDQLFLLRKGELDGAWTVEPWVTRAVHEAGASILLEEKALWPETNGRYVTTHLVASAKILSASPDLVRRFVAAHLDLTNWINKNPELAKETVRKEILAETRQDLKREILDEAWTRLEFTHDPVPAALRKTANQAHALGFLKGKPDLSRIYDLSFLNAVLAEQDLPRISL